MGTDEVDYLGYRVKVKYRWKPLDLAPFDNLFTVKNMVCCGGVSKKGISDAYLAEPKLQD